MITAKQETHIPINKDGIEYFTVQGLDLVHKEMLFLLKIIDEICQENNLSYWLDGGTLIGAIRHKGFIPWDDDLDISLMKKDYIILLELLDEYSSKNSDTFLLFPTPQNIHCCNYFASNKVHSRLRGSLSTIPVKIDIRPVNAFEDTPESTNENLRYRDIANQLIFKKSHGYATDKQIADIKAKGVNSFFDFYNNSYGINYTNADATLLSHPYFEFSDEFPLKINNILPTVYVEFESIKLPIPKDYALLLTKLYGNYNEFPPLENRVPVAYEILTTKFPNYFIKINSHFINNGSIIKKIYRRLRLYALGLRLYGISKFIKINTDERK